VAERVGLSESFFNSAGFPEKAASRAGYWDTLRTTKWTTFRDCRPPRSRFALGGVDGFLLQVPHANRR
jgi:hypothetical protein